MKIEVVELLRCKNNADIKYAQKDGTYKGTALTVETAFGPKSINIVQGHIDRVENTELKEQLNALEGFTGLITVKSDMSAPDKNGKSYVRILGVAKAPEGSRVGLVRNDATQKPAFVKSEGTSSKQTTSGGRPSGFDDPEVIARITRNQALTAAVQIAKSAAEAISIAEVFAEYIHHGVPKPVAKPAKVAETVDLGDEEGF